jgi:PAS domain S-box-containing protein
MSSVPSLPTATLKTIDPAIAREAARLAALEAYAIMDSAPEAAFDDIVAIAAQICQVPMALISLIDSERQWFKAAVGLEVQQTPREIAFCAQAIQQDHALVVEDAAADPRFAANPLVTGDPNLRFYAGAQLLTPDGLALGTLCVLDRRPRQLTDAQLSALQALSRQVITQMELRKALAMRHTEAERSRLIIESAVDYAIVSIDLQGRVTSWNPGAERILGWSAAEMRGAELSCIFTPEDTAGGRMQKEMNDALCWGTGNDERWHMRKSGARFWANGEMTPIRDDSEKVVGFVKVLRDRTDQHQATEALRASEERSTRAQSAGGVGVFELDIRSNTLRGSPEFCRLFGLPHQDTIPAERIEALIHPDDRRRLSLGRTEPDHASLDVEYRILREDDKQLRWIARKGRYEIGADGRVARLVGVVQDISDRRVAQLDAEQSAAQFQTFAQALPNHVWTALPDGRLDWFNDRLLEYSGMSRPDLDGFGWTKIVHPDDIGRSARQWSETLVTGEVYETEFRLRRSDGVFRWHLTRALPLRAADGSITRWVGTNTDIHERKLSEAASTRDRDRIWSLSQELMLVCDLDGVIQAVNPSATRLLGYDAQDMIGCRMADFLHPEDVGRTAQEIATLADGRSTLAFENRYRAKGGGYRLLDWTAVPDGGHIHAVARDVTQERATAADRERIWNSTNDLLGTLDGDGCLRSVNPAWKRLLGHEESELLSRPLLDFIDPEDRPRLAEVIRRLSAGEPVLNLEDRLRHADGRYSLMAWSAQPVDNLFYIVGRDVTEQRAAEDALRQSQKMEAVGQLTGGIAHDFNNLLQGITGSLDLVRKRTQQSRFDEIERFISGAMTSANRAAALTHRLLAFSRRQPLDPKPVEANPLVASMEDLLRRTLGEKIEFEMVIGTGLWLTRCDPNQLESAILNLVINARDAMPDGGRLVIETRNEHLDRAAALKWRDVKAGQYVSISVTDTGAGMSADTVSKAFEPFFTTKPIGQGTGLGLSMIYGFVRQSEGHVDIHSELGKGTTVRLYLPRFRGEAGAAELSGELSEAQRAEANETVLVVEDEPVVRGLIVEILSDLGYRAIEASDGPAGLALLQSSQRIDLLVSDIGLPGLNGPQVADAARLLRPGLKVLFMTGYAENAAMAAGFLGPGMSMITKPFAMEVLASRIREMLEPKPPRDQARPA